MPKYRKGFPEERVMWRRGLTLYFVFVLAAGPWFCCCTLARAASQIHGLLRPSDKLPAPCPCCCCERANEEPTHKNHGDEAPAVPGKCPCRDQRDKALVDSGAGAHCERILRVWSHCCSWLPAIVTKSGPTEILTAASRPAFGGWSLFSHLARHKSLSTLQTLLC